MRHVEQQPDRGPPAQLVLGEQADGAVLAVVAGLADGAALTHAPDRFGHQGRAGAGDLLRGSIGEDEQLRPDPAQ